MPADDSRTYSFRPVQAADLDRLRSWLAQGHVARWWGDPHRELQEIRDILATGSAEPFMILMDERPIGYIQSYATNKVPGHPGHDQPAGTVGIDIFIGEAELIGQGHGPQIADAFASRAFAGGAARLVVDPDPANRRAVRAYEKAGFRIVGPCLSPQGPALLMARDAQHEVRPI